MGGDDALQVAMVQDFDEFSASLVRKMSVSPANPCLEGGRIRSLVEHGGIVIRFDEQAMATLQGLLDVGGNAASIRQDAEFSPIGLDDVLQGFP